jgi:hypothetical protein
MSKTDFVEGVELANRATFCKEVIVQAEYKSYFFKIEVVHANIIIFESLGGGNAKVFPG